MIIIKIFGAGNIISLVRELEKDLKASFFPNMSR